MHVAVLILSNALTNLFLINISCNWAIVKYPNIVCHELISSKHNYLGFFLINTYILLQFIDKNIISKNFCNYSSIFELLM